MRPKKKSYALLWLLPASILVVGQMSLPLFYTLYFSFTNKSLLGSEYTWIGADNYIHILSSGEFWSSFTNSFIFAVGGTVLTLLFGLGVAFLLNEPFKGRTIVSGFLLFPYLVPTIAATFMFRWMFNDRFGIVDFGLASLGLPYPSTWLGSPSTAMFIVILVSVWRFFPFVVICVLARLQIIPSELYDAAKVDGASVLQRLRHVTLPQLRSVIFILIVLRTIWNFNNFDLIWLLTGGGPASATQTLTIMGYLETFRLYNVGTGSVVCTVSFLTVLILSLIYFSFSKVEI